MNNTPAAPDSTAGNNGPTAVAVPVANAATANANNPAAQQQDAFSSVSSREYFVGI